MNQRVTLLTLSLMMFFGVHLISATGVPLLVSPVNASSLATNEILLQWKSADATHPMYDVQIALSGDFSTIIAEQKNLEGTSLMFNASERDQNYFWRVRATLQGESSAWSSIGSFLVLPLSPVPPALVTPLNNEINVGISPILRWNSIPDMVYQVQLSRSASFDAIIVNMTVPATGKAAEVILGGLEYFSSYYWRVRGKNATGVSQWSESFRFTTTGTALGTPSPLSPPNNVTLAYVSSLQLSWNTVEKASSYDIQIATDNNFASITAQTDNFEGNSLSFSNVLNNKQYYWRVRARNGATIGEWSSVSMFSIGYITESIVPAPPMLASPENGAQQQKTASALAWQAVSNAMTYDVELSPTPQFYTVTYKASSLTETTTSVSNLSPGMTYYWRVRSVNGDGIGNWSTANSFSTGNAPYAPALQYPASEQMNIPALTTLRWESSPNASAYQIQVSTTSNFRELVYEAKEVKGTEIEANLPANTLLFWRVRATNEFGAGTWSSWRYFRTVGSISSVEDEHFLLSNVTVMPNPSSALVKISYTLPAKGHIMLTLMDEMGNPVSTLVNAEQNIGTYEIPISTISMEQGVYLYHINYNGVISTGKFVLIR